MTQELLTAMTHSILDGDSELARDLALQALQAGLDPLQAINQGFMPGVTQVGEGFSCGDLFLPDLVAAGEAMKAAVNVLEPEMARRGAERQVPGKVVLATIHGDIHDIGKTLVGTMLSASGFQVYDLGVDAPIATLIEKAVEVQADMIGVSSLLTTTMVRQRELIQTLTERGLRGRFKVLVGGAPVTRSWADEIGADGYSEDAVGAVQVARRLMQSA